MGRVGEERQKRKNLLAFAFTSFLISLQKKLPKEEEEDDKDRRSESSKGSEEDTT